MQKVEFEFATWFDILWNIIDFKVLVMFNFASIIMSNLFFLAGIGYFNWKQNERNKCTGW